MPPAHDKAASGSGTKGSDGEDSSSSSDSNNYFVRNVDPEAVATELGAKPTVIRLGGNIVKSLHFESRDSEHTLLRRLGAPSASR